MVLFLSAEALEPAREIYALAIDDNLNVWTLTLGAGGKDPAKTPLVIEYDKNGETLSGRCCHEIFFHRTRVLLSQTQRWEQKQLVIVPEPFGFGFQSQPTSSRFALATERF